MRTARAAGLGQYLVLDYPASGRDAPSRRASGRLHDAVAAGEDRYRASLRTIAGYEAGLRRIQVHGGDEAAPAWRNGFLPGLDAAAIYAFLRDRAPRTYLEVGSGWSNRFARRAISDGELETRSSRSIRARERRSTGSATRSCAVRSSSPTPPPSRN